MIDQIETAPHTRGGDLESIIDYLTWNTTDLLSKRRLLQLVRQQQSAKLEGSGLEQAEAHTTLSAAYAGAAGTARAHCEANFMPHHAGLLLCGPWVVVALGWAKTMRMHSDRAVALMGGYDKMPPALGSVRQGILRGLGHHNEAAKCIELALEKPIGEPEVRAHLLAGRADIFARERRLEEALSSCQEAAELALAAVVDRRQSVTILRPCAETALLCGECDLAQQCWEQACAFAEQTGAADQLLKMRARAPLGVLAT